MIVHFPCSLFVFLTANKKETCVCVWHLAAEEAVTKNQHESMEFSGCPTHQRCHGMGAPPYLSGQPRSVGWQTSTHALLLLCSLFLPRLPVRASSFLSLLSSFFFLALPSQRLPLLLLLLHRVVCTATAATTAILASCFCYHDPLQ